ncbi:MAG TPA: hypothetical protein DIC59_07635 [Candidatus Competibacteraceae bacterium]|nr:hypothetical protein [Candidatus Competibacteraceae bacterium]
MRRWWRRGGRLAHRSPTVNRTRTPISWRPEAIQLTARSKQQSGYNRRSLGETAMFRLKALLAGI